MAILEIKDLSAGYGEVQVLWNVNMALEANQLTALVGGNGVGKTTLLRAAMGLVKPSSGQVIFDGQIVNQRSPHNRAEHGLVLVPEGRQLFTDMSVLENLEMGASPIRAREHYSRNLERVFEMFPRLHERREQKAGTLSGGEQQMLAVGRGIMGEPKVLMIDELSLGLAPVLVLRLFETLLELKNLGITVLLVEQNVPMALAISDYAFVLSLGRIELEGPSRIIQKNEHIRSAYLGL